MSRPLCPPLVSFLVAVSPGLATAQLPEVHALKDVRVVTGTGQVLERATVVLRKGRIHEVGAGVVVPVDAEVHSGEKWTVYPGLIDALAGGGAKDAPAYLAPEARGAELYDPSDARWSDARKNGFVAALVSPGGAGFRGRSSVMSLSGLSPAASLLRPDVFSHASFAGNRGGAYPSTLFGTVAFLRQSLLDADHARTLEAFAARERLAVERPRFDPSLQALRPVLEGKLPLVFDAEGENDILRALSLGKEFGVAVRVAGCREVLRVMREVERAGSPLFLSLAFREPPRRDEEPPASRPTGRAPRKLRKEDVESVRAVVASGLPFAFCSAGTPDYATLRRNLLVAVKNGVPGEKALEGLTLGAARILGVEQELGSIERGKLGSLVVTDGDLLKDGTKVVELFVEGKRIDLAARPAAAPAAAGGPAGETPAPGTPQDPADRMRRARREREGQVAAAGGQGQGESRPGSRPAREDVAEVELVETVDPERPILATSGRQEKPLLLKNATVVTGSPQGTLTKASVLVEGGKIRRIAQGAIEAPEGAEVLDLTGKFLAAGIIDCHSHMVMDRGTNESTVAVSCMVRVSDAIDHRDGAVFGALAGGVTAANVMHGSANPIGGQNAVVKLKWGRPAAEMLVEDAPLGVKFALGENPKRTHRTRPGGPSSRMGVERTIRDAFEEARKYMEGWKKYRESGGANGNGGPAVAPPRRDLRLDALAQILEGKMRIHCHCYVSGEIVMILELCKEFGIRIAALQHVLEGYKVADEIAAHGAGASTFADSWAYKIEAYEAIPHNAALMTQRGVVVSINSDSGERVRRLNVEAAKCVRYGGLSPEQAWALVTMNPARQLGIEGRTGSIEEGKDADLAVWNADPLSVYSRCEKTFVEGVLYFDRERTPNLKQRIEEEEAKKTAPAAASRAVTSVEKEDR